MQSRTIRAVFWALVAVFIIIAGVIAIPAAREVLIGPLFLAISGAALLALGATLIVLTARGRGRGIAPKFLILTGAAAAGIPLGAILHNFVYGLFIYWFGADFWGNGDEPFFFVLAIVVCPIAFLVGAAGSIVLALREPEP